MLKFVVVTETDIFGAKQKKRKKKKYYEGTKINDFAELVVGDYVVHESHGLGIYRGIEKVEMNGTIKDYLKIEYRDNGNRHLKNKDPEGGHRAAFFGIRKLLKFSSFSVIFCLFSEIGYEV